MLLWAVLTVIAVVVAAALTVPLVRRYEAKLSPREATLAVLRDQLADVDAQAASGAVDSTEAEALRTEIKRRMLASGREVEVAARPLGSASLGRLAIGMAAFVAVAGTALYATLGRPDLGGAPDTAPAAAAGVAAGAVAQAGPDAAAIADVAGMITQLEARMKAQPGDPEGWRMLGWSYFQTSRFKESAEAYGRAVQLAPNAPGYASAYGEALVQAAGGRVTPAAKAQFEVAARQDKADARARYFLGVAKAEAGDHKGAVDDWLKLLGEAPADAPWVPELRRIIGDTARTAGIDVTARLAAVTPSSAPNPSAEQVQSVQAMAPADQQAMIRGMVERLAAKLKANPRDAAGWVRLMRARMVLGDAAAAAAAQREALAALAGDSAAVAQVNEAATAMGVSAK